MTGSDIAKKKKWLRKRKNSAVLISRIRALWPAVATCSFISLIDIGYFYLIGLSLTAITTKGKALAIAIGIIAIAGTTVRIMLVIRLRRVLSNVLFRKKLSDETQILERLLTCKHYASRSGRSRSDAKEILLNSTNICTINFDLPAASLIGEIVFAIGALILLSTYIELRTFVWISPAIATLAILMGNVAKQLRTFGSDMILKTKEKIRWLDNITESADELTTTPSRESAIQIYANTSGSLNNILGRQVYISASSQVYAESFATIIICLLVILWQIGLLEFKAGGVASSLAVLSRLLPTITRSIASITQLQYGVPAVYRYSHYIETLEK